MVLINNKARIISSDIICTNGIIHVIDKLLSPQNLLITPKDASGMILVGELIVRLLAWSDSQDVIYYINSAFEALFKTVKFCCFNLKLLLKTSLGLPWQFSG